MKRALVWNFARQELVDRYAGSALGITWAFIQPLVQLFIFVVIFGQIMGARLSGEESRWGYSIYLIAGMLPWLAFVNTLTRVATVFTDKQHLLIKVGLPLPTLPVFVVLAECVTFLISLGLFLLLVLLVQHPWKIEVLALPVVFLIQQTLAYGLGIVLATVNVFFRDVREFVGVLTQLWFWLTPIVWVPAVVSSELYELIRKVNPMIPLVDAYHAMFIDAMDLPVRSVLLVAVLAAGMLAVGLYAVTTLEREMRDSL